MTCNLCPSGCSEIGNQLFYWKTRKDGEVLTKKCKWLNYRKDGKYKWTPSKLDNFCNKKAPEGHLNGAQVCPVSCKTCDEL